MSEPTVFERIVARELPADIVYEDESLIAFPPIEQLAPVHLLVVPKTAQYENVVELAAADPALLAHLIEVSQKLASEHSNGEFRLVFNSGASIGQTVFHAHAHVLSGALEEGSLGQL